MKLSSFKYEPDTGIATPKMKTINHSFFKHTKRFLAYSWMHLITASVRPFAIIFSIATVHENTTLCCLEISWFILSPICDNYWPSIGPSE